MTERRIHKKCVACNGEAASHRTPFFKDAGFYVQCKVCNAATKTYNDKRNAWKEWDDNN